jgi:flagellar hook-length control protein FliK
VPPSLPSDGAADEPTDGDHAQDDGAHGNRRERAPGPPPSAAAWQHAAPPAHASSPLAGNVAADPAATQPAAAPAANATPAAPASPAEHRSGVLLTHAAETLRLTISAANAQGVSRARIALKPAELGGIEIALAHGPSGLSATVTADSAQAAHALQRAADELQRTLAQQGLSLVRLEINVAGEGPQARGREDRGTSADDHGAGRAAAADETDESTAARTIELPNGALVDVLA